jgi:hypothetical protein
MKKSKLTLPRVRHEASLDKARHLRSQQIDSHAKKRMLNKGPHQPLADKRRPLPNGERVLGRSDGGRLVLEHVMRRRRILQPHIHLEHLPLGHFLRHFRRIHIELPIPLTQLIDRPVALA